MDTSENSHHDDDIIMEENESLDWNLITYALNSNRLLFIKNHIVWAGFYSANKKNFDKYLDFTPEQLCKRFLQCVLPHIEDYELTEHEEHLLNLLKLHPNFIQTEKGFEAVEATEEIMLPQNEEKMQGIVANNIPDEIIFGTAVNTNNPIIVAPIEEQYVYGKFKLVEESGALISVSLTSNLELPNCELLSIIEINNRIKEAIHLFGSIGQQPETINISVDELLKKLQMVVELKNVLIELINKGYKR